MIQELLQKLYMLSLDPVDLNLREVQDLKNHRKTVFRATVWHPRELPEFSHNNNNTLFGSNLFYFPQCHQEKCMRLFRVIDNKGGLGRKGGYDSYLKLKKTETFILLLSCKYGYIILKLSILAQNKKKRFNTLF